MVAGLKYAELRSLSTIDGEPLSSIPAQGGAFEHWIRAMIGVRGEIGEESFDFVVCSPDRLADELERQGAMSGRFMMIARRYDPAEVEQYAARRVAEAKGPDWATIAEKLSRWSLWEFEDYHG